MIRFRKHRGGVDASERAVQQAQETLHQIKAREPEVRQLAQNMKVVRQKNHFAEQLLTMIEQGIHHERP